MDVRSRRLDNGLTLATVRLPGFQTLSVGVFVRAGTRHEPPRLNGLAHVLEHMAFKGTAHRDARALSLATERVGASLNAYTAKDVTVYHADALAGHEATVLDVLADVVRYPAFPEDELERERRVILQELDEAGDDPESLAQDAFDAAAFPEQTVGQPILGSRKAIRSVRRDDLLAWHARHYCASNLIIVAAGCVDHPRFDALVTERFGDSPTGLPAEHEPARYVGGYRHVDQEFEQTAVLLGWPVPPRTSGDFVHYEMLADLLGGGASSPLFQSIREQHGLAYRIDTWIDGGRDGTMLQIGAGVDARDLPAFFDRVCETLLAVMHGVHADDLERTRNLRLLGLAHQHERPMELAEALAHELAIHGAIATPEARIERTRAVSGPAISAAAKSLLAATPTVALVGRGGRRDPRAGIQRRLQRGG